VTFELLLNAVLIPIARELLLIYSLESVPLLLPLVFPATTQPTVLPGVLMLDVLATLMQVDLVISATPSPVHAPLKPTTSLLALKMLDADGSSTPAAAAASTKNVETKSTAT